MYENVIALLVRNKSVTLLVTDLFLTSRAMTFSYIALLVRNKSVTLLVVEPLNCTFHYDTSKKYKKIVLLQVISQLSLGYHKC